MKREKWLSCLMGAILSFAGAVAGVGCVMTGLFMSAPFDVIMLWIAAWSLIVALMLMLPNGGKWLTALIVAALAVLFRQKEMLLQVEAFLNKISLVYDAAYGWGMIIWSESIDPELPVTGALVLLGCLSATGICLTVCRRKWLPVGLLAGFLPLALCCVVTDTVPEAGYLWLLLSVLILMLLTHYTGRLKKSDGIRLTAMLMVPVMLGMLLLFSVVKPETYDQQSAQLQQLLSGVLQKLPVNGTGVGNHPGITGAGITMDRVDLADVGPQSRQNYAIMDVVAPITETIYLRGQALDSYDGTSWSLGDGADQMDSYWPYTGLKYRGRMVITTRSVHPMKYVPYYTTEIGSAQQKGLAPQQQNGDNQIQYEMFLWTPETGLPLYSVTNSLDGAAVYLELPEATRQRAENLLKQILTQEKTMAEKAETIRYYVEMSARYDLNTPQMPAGEEDFALWFLEESDSGYCVHFASAAAVLLRAAGIPARYVTGFTVNTASSRRVTVTAQQAHAWVEYLDENMAWKVLEATPVDVENTQPRPTVPHPTEESTEPSQETTAPTQESTEDTTEPEDTGDSTETTAPPASQATRPTVGVTKPTEDEPSPEPEKQLDLTWLWRALKVTGWVAIGVGTVILQYALRLRHRRKGMYAGSANQQAINRWRYGKRLAKHLRCALPEGLDFLAEKAAYSQHLLTAEELAEFDAWLETKHKELSRWPVLSKLFVKFIFAIG